MNTVLRVNDTARVMGVSRATIWNWANPKSRHFRPDFPKPIKLSANITGWLSSEILEAARAYANAAAKLVGIGKAAAEMRANLLENGLRVDCPTYGQGLPNRIIDLRLPGFFNMMDGASGEENAISTSWKTWRKKKKRLWTI